MSETIVSLSEESRLELSQIIEENVLEEAPSEEFLNAFIEREQDDLVLEGIKWGFGDTVVREEVMSSCAKWLVGREWPRYGDRLTDEQFAEFEENVKQAYKAWAPEIKK